MRLWLRAVVGIALVVLVAAAGIAVNFRLLRLTQDAQDPVGKLSPRVVFVQRIPTAPATSTGGAPDTDDGASGGRDSDD